MRGVIDGLAAFEGNRNRIVFSDLFGLARVTIEGAYEHAFCVFGGAGWRSDF